MENRATQDQDLPLEPWLERHLPIELDVLEDDLAERFPDAERDAFRAFAQRLSAHWAVAFQERLAELRRAYRPFDPSRDTAAVPGEEPDDERRSACVAGLAALLERANYIELARVDLERALQEVSPEGVSVAVDMDELLELHVFVRGRFQRSLDVRRLWRREAREHDGYRRLFLAVALRSQPERLHLRLYKDVTGSDLEMFLPNTRVRMRLFDKVKLSVTGGGGTVGGVVATATKVGAATSIFGWTVALGGFAAVLWRQVSQVFHQRTRYMARHARALYFHTLDNDLGALVHVAQMALQQEAKEALCAYAFLATSPDALEQPELDRRIEAHLHERHGIRADFEVDDGLAKLEELGLLERSATGLRVPAPGAARDALAQA